MLSTKEPRTLAPSKAINIYESNFRALAKLLGHEFKECFPEYIRCKSKGFMDLTFDLIHQKDGGAQYAMAHWFELNGDWVQDLEMMLEIKGETVEVLSIMHSPPFNQVIPVYFRKDGVKFVNTKQKHEQNKFLKTWLRNLKAQGFAVAQD